MGRIAIVVDDNELDRYLARRLLSRQGGFDKILEAATGQDFLDELCATGVLEDENPPPDVHVFMDINMPGLNGFETANRLTTLISEMRVHDRINVTMFTSSENPDDKARAAAIKIIQGYIVKPMSMSDLDALPALTTAQKR